MRGAVIAVALMSGSADAQPGEPMQPGPVAPPDTAATAGASGGVTVESAPGTPPAQPAAPPTAGVTTAGSVTAGGSGTVSVEPVWPVHAEYGLDFGFGVVRGDAPINGFGGLFAMDINLFLVDWLAIGGTGQLTLSADPAVDDPATPEFADGMETENYKGWSGGGGPRFRFYDADVAHEGFAHREGWVLDIDAGWMVVDGAASEAGPFGRLTLGRQILAVKDRGNGVNLGMGIAVERGFGAVSEHQAVLSSFWFHGEGGAAIAATRTADRDPPLWPATFGVDAATFLGKNFGKVDASGGVIGLAVSYGIGASELVEPLVRADVLSLRHTDGSDANTMLGGTAGLRFRFNRWAQWQGELLGGYEHAYGATPLRIGSGPVVDLGTGIHIVACKYGVDLGTRLRLGVGDDNDHLHSLALIIGFVRGNQEGAAGRPRKRCDGGLNR